MKYFDKTDEIILVVLLMLCLWTWGFCSGYDVRATQNMYITLADKTQNLLDALDAQ